MREGRDRADASCRATALDVLAQQIVAIAAAAEPTPSAVDELHALVTRTHSYAELVARAARERPRHARRALPVGRVRRAAPAHRLGPRRRARSARARARASSRSRTRGTIPDRGLFARHARPTAAASASSTRRWSTRRARARRSCSARRRGASRRSAATASSSRPRPACPARCRSGAATRSGRPNELGAGDRRVQPLGGRPGPPSALDAPSTTSTSSPRATSLEYLREQQEATRRRARATARSSSSASATRSATGACACSRRSAAACTPPGRSRCARGIRERLGLEVRRDLVRRRHHRPPPRRRRAAGADARAHRARRARGPRRRPSWARPRCSARASARTPARALLIPARSPGKRTPLWQQRLKSPDPAGGRQALRAVPDHARDLPRVPAATSSTCPACTDLLRDAARRASCRSSRSRRRPPSPFASSLLFDYVATYMYEGDTPNAERRAAALSLDRDLLRELLGQDELRELIDPDALDAGRGRPAAPLASAPGADRATGWPTSCAASATSRPPRRADRVLAGLDAAAMLLGARGRAARRARPRRSAARSAGSPPTTPACTATRFGAVPPGGLPAAFLADVDDPLRARRRALRAHARAVHHRRAARPLRRRPVGRAARRSSATGELVRGELRPGRHRARVVRPRGAAAAAPRVAGVAAQGDRGRRPARAGAPSCPSWQGVDRHPAARRGRSTACARCSSRCRAWRCPPSVWERDVLPRRMRRVLADVAGPALRVGRGRLGRRRRARAQLGPRRAVLPRGRARRSARRRCARASSRRTSPSTSRSASACAAGAVLLHRPARRAAAGARGAPGGAVGPRLGGRGDQRRVGAAARAAADARPRAARDARAPARPGRRALRRAAADGAQPPGAGPLVADVGRSSRPAARRPGRAQRRALGRAAARALRDRHPRAGARRGRSPGGFSALYDALVDARDARRLPARLLRRGPRRRAVRAARRGRAPARAAATTTTAPPLVLAATDPAQPYGAALPWPKRDGDDDAPRAARPRRRRLRRARRRRAGRSTSSAAAAACRCSWPTATTRGCGPALEALAAFVTGGRGRKLSLERVDGEPVVGSPIEAALIELGFRAGPRKLTLSA